MKKYNILFISTILLYSTDAIKLPLTGVEIIQNNKKVLIEREVNSKCLDVGITQENFWSEDFAKKSVPKECKKTFITIKGIIQPFSIASGVETVGEIEVLEFIKEKSSKDSTKYLLVDSRPNDWFTHSTIPSAINIPYGNLKINEIYKDEYMEAYEMLGVTIKDSKFNFNNAKEIILFCNALWCTQSPKAIKQLLKIGYPANKIKWYRGGLVAWSGVGLSLTNR